MDKTIKKRIHEQLDKSTIPDEIKLMYVVASACQYIIEHVDRRIRGVYQANGFDIKSNEYLSGLNDYCKAIKIASMRFYDRVESMIVKSTFNIAGAKAYDGFNGDATELVRLLMLYVDRTSRNDGKAKEVFDLLHGMPEQGVFKKEDVEHFIMR